MLSPYIDGQLSPSEMERIERHIEECDDCRRELESLRAVVSLLHRVPIIAPQRSFTIAAKAPRRRPVALRALRVATAVAVLVLAFVFALHFFELGPVEDRSIQQEYAPTYTPTSGEGSDTEAETPEAEGYGWPDEATPVPSEVIEKDLTYTVVNRGIETGEAALWSLETLVEAWVELKNTDDVGGEFRFEFYFTVDGLNYYKDKDSDSVYISAGETKTLRVEIEVETWVDIIDWYPKVIPPTKTVIETK